MACCPLRGPADNNWQVCGGFMLCFTPWLYFLLSFISAICKCPLLYLIPCFWVLLSVYVQPSHQHHHHHVPHLKFHGCDCDDQVLVLSSFSDVFTALGPDCGDALVWVGILEMVHLPLFVTPALLMVRVNPAGVVSMILPCLGILSILLNPLFGIVFPFVILNNTKASDPSWCCWSGSDATAMGWIQFLMVTDAILYVPTVLSVGSWYMEAKSKHL